MSDKKYAVDPALVDYDEAFKLLNRATLAVYQVFYFAGLTNPLGSPWKIELNNHGSTIYSGFKLTHKGCNPLFGRNPLELLPKVRMVQDAIVAGKTLVNAQACCPLATIRACVCVIAFDCPAHGGQCIGSHD